MDVFKATLLYVCTVVFFGGTYGESCNNDLTNKSAAIQLSNDLFYTYNKNVRPVMTQSTQVTVNTSFHIFNVHMNEKWNILQVNLYLVMTWKDEFLIWNYSKYDNIKRLYEDSTTIWIPDLIAYDEGFNGENSQKTSNLLPASVVSISYDGIVKYRHRITLSVQCTANIAKWPFDSHECPFYIGNPLYTVMYVNYTFPNGYYDLTYYLPDREWNVNTIQHDCVNLFYAETNTSRISYCILKYNIAIKRFSSMYYSSVIIPALVISLMSNLTFLMGHEPLLRVILLCVFFISELLYIQFLDTKIPNNGEHLVYIVLLYRNTLVITAMALVISVISNELYKHGIEEFPRNGPKWLKSHLTLILNIRPIDTLINFNTRGAERLIENSAKEDTPNSQRDENALFWKTLSVTLDRFSFIITLVISLINFWYFKP